VGAGVVAVAAAGIRIKIRVILAIAASTYKEWAAYRTHSLVSVFVGPAYFLTQICIWRAVYSGTDSIRGISLDAMITYYGVTTLVSYLTMDFADWNLQMLIRTGKFTTFVLRPIHHRLFAFAQKLGHRTLGLLFEFLPALLIFVFIFHMEIAPVRGGYFLVSVALSYIMVFTVNYSIGIAAFWLVRTDGLRSVIKLLTSVCSGALFPLLLLPDALQRILFFLPFQFTAYVPSMVYTGTYRLGTFSMGIPQIVCVQAVYTATALVLSELLYRFGLKRFTAAGV
jgi:ABC-2 type transport system permease protein